MVRPRSTKRNSTTTGPGAGGSCIIGHGGGSVGGSIIAAGLFGGAVSGVCIIGDPGPKGQDCTNALPHGRAFSFEPEMSPMTAYDSANVFAKILKGELPAHKVRETDAALAFMDIMPRADGHVLVIPKTAARNILDIAPDDLAELIREVQIVARGVKKAMGADGVTIQQFNESAGGQVVFHIHFHVIPRWEGQSLRPHTGQMADGEMLKMNAARISAALGSA
jgi:histidine triad (HIT) family protein